MECVTYIDCKDRNLVNLDSLSHQIDFAQQVSVLLVQVSLRQRDSLVSIVSKFLV